jgi:hypothetical protein
MAAPAMGIIGGEIGKKLLGLKNGGGAVKTHWGGKSAGKKLKKLPFNGANLTSYGKMMMKKSGGKVKGRKRRGRVKR